MIRVTGRWLDNENSQVICRLLSEAGAQVYFVGGCVRNALLGVAVNDLDLTTDMPPDQVMALAHAAGIKAIGTGIEHGTVTLVRQNVAFEITTFRRDVATDGRRAVVAFSNSIIEDARRRDFTMNALYARPDGTVVDPLGGMPDLLARRIRFIEDADARIREDYLRILRFFRFYAWYGDPDQGLDPEGLAACAANSAGLETLSRERIGAELLKLLAADDPAPSVAAMAQSGVLPALLPGAAAKILPILVHLEGLCAVNPTGLRRLAALGGADVDLRLSKKQARNLQILREAMGSSEGPGALAYRLGFDLAQDILLLRAAMFEQPVATDAFDLAQQGADAKFPVSAKDLMPAFQGPALGQELKRLEQLWIMSQFGLTRAELLA